MNQVVYGRSQSHQHAARDDAGSHATDAPNALPFLISGHADQVLQREAFVHLL